MRLMRTPPDISPHDLARWLKSLYAIRPRRARFVAHGECGWLYLIFTEPDGDQPDYVLKLTQPDLCREGSFRQDVIVTHMALYYDHGLRQISPPPLRASTGLYINDLDGYQAKLLPYIAGTPVSELEFTASQQRKLGALIATLHRCKLHDDELPPVERFSTNVVRQLGELLNMATVPSDDPIERDLRHTLRELTPRLKRLSARFVALAQALRADEDLCAEFVICHGDPSAGNIIVSPDNNVYLIDWDTPIYAPPERDLFFLRPWLDARESYAAIIGERQADRRVLHYYQLEWDLGEIVDYGKRLLRGVHEEQQRLHDQRELHTHLEGMGLL